MRRRKPTANQPNADWLSDIIHTPAPSLEPIHNLDQPGSTFILDLAPLAETSPEDVIAIRPR
jgi:hypothetical protein